MKKILYSFIAGLLIFALWFAGSLYMDIREIYRDRDDDYDFADDYDEEIPEPPELDSFSLADPGFIADPERVNILLIGVDGDASARAPRSDSIMLFSVNKKTGDPVLISIPRDTYVQIPGRRADKINHSHAFGGAALLRESVSGFMDVPVDYYLRVNFDGFKGIVDMLGGVNIYVERDMPNRKLWKGQQVLTGEQALWYVRDREDGDLNRAARQQQFLVAVAKQAQSAPFTQFSPLIREGVKHVDTDMPMMTLLDFAQQFWNMDPDAANRYVIPGSGFMHEGVYYLQPDIEVARTFVNKNLKVPK
ncbi:MAG: LytR family transcriptional regulator [Firmicutes bacterium]|nr:LytR family transcriptional regulator [Bacillota bacterium]